MMMHDAQADWEGAMQAEVYYLMCMLTVQMGLLLYNGGFASSPLWRASLLVWNVWLLLIIFFRQW
jgi:hypothetical protein